MLKRFCILFLLLFFQVSLYSQVEPVEDRLTGGGFGALTSSFRSINNSTAVYSGGGGGFIVNDFRIGAFFAGLTNSYSSRDTSNNVFKLGLSYGGLWLSYPFYLDNKSYHPIVEIKSSIGSMRFIDTNWVAYDSSVFWGFSAAIGLEYKLTNILFLAGGLKYHYTYMTEETLDLSGSDFSSFGIYISIRLGTFDGVFM